VWQTKDFKSCIFGCVAKRELTERFFGCVVSKGVIVHPSLRLGTRKSAIRALVRGKRVENKMEGGGYPIPGILQCVRKRLSSKELEEAVVFKCGASVRNRLIAKDLRETFTLKCAASGKAPLPLGRGKKELEETEKVEEAAWAASRRFIRDAKAALRRA
jgi:hypothetical protein